jgi:uncharacterized protein YndB with AHSA1/START domain
MYLATLWLQIVAQPVGCTSPEGGRVKLNREITLPATAAEVWDSLTEPAWLGEGASIDLRPAGEVRVGERAGFVEQAEEPRRLVFWWSRPEEDATRVEIDLEEADGETVLRVVESRPLAMLDLRGVDFVVSARPPRAPEMMVR